MGFMPRRKRNNITTFHGISCHYITTFVAIAFMKLFSTKLLHWDSTLLEQIGTDNTENECESVHTTNSIESCLANVALRNAISG